MVASLIATKLQIPPQPHHVLRRARLIDALERTLLDYKLILVAAPAGYGKTTLLAQWARSSRFAVVWLTLDAPDNDFERFFRYLLTGWEAAQPGVIKSPLGLLLGSLTPDRDAVLTAFINVANDVREAMVFVLDDYHLIEDSSIHQALSFLLDHLPPMLHFVLAGRGEPPLPLARYRARQELVEFRAGELNFLPEETADFLAMMGLALAHDEVVKLHVQLEGWIAGLQLVALSRQQRLTGADTLVVSGRQRFIADYLSEDVLAYLPNDIRRFLLQTSILDHLCGPLCDAVTAGEGGQAMLEAVERENLFLVSLDDSRAWFRYHPLFAGFLREELNRRHPDAVILLHRRAARWYLAHDLPEQAFHHARAGEDAELVTQVLEIYFDVKLYNGEFRVIERWLEALPAQWHVDYPMLGLARAGLLAFTGAVEACVRCVDEVEQRLAPMEGEQACWQQARVTALRCTIACFQNDLTQAETYADRALRDLRARSEEDDSFRAMIYGALGDTYRHNGRWAEARANYLKALDLVQVPAFHIKSAHAFGALADLELQQGRLRNSAAYWRKALAIIEDRTTWGSLPLPLIGWVYIRMGELLYEWNDLAGAWDHLARGLERADVGGDVRAMIAGYVIAGRLKLTTGDLAAADEFLERARPLVENAPFPDWIGRFGRFQLEFWLAQDRVRAAVDWVGEMLQGDAGKGGPESEEAHLAMARVLIVKGDAPSIGQAQLLLKRLLQTAEAEGRAGIQIEALALQALADWRRGERGGAMTSLERALRLAEPQGYVRLFADLGLPMARLLQEARARAVMPDYIQALLAAFDGDRLFSLPSATLPEPLSPREQEVLELVAAGLTNREIAEQLVISAATVKKHVGNLSAKLGVSNRTQAAARARELDLLA
jgi:LuxR family maltose regulon positive regulatory protein